MIYSNQAAAPNLIWTMPIGIAWTTYSKSIKEN